MVLDSLTAGQNEALIIRASQGHPVSQQQNWAWNWASYSTPQAAVMLAGLPLLAGKLPMARLLRADLFLCFLHPPGCFKTGVGGISFLSRCCCCC